MSQAWICIPSPSTTLVLGKYLLAVLIVLAARFVSAIVRVRSYNNLKMMENDAVNGDYYLPEWVLLKRPILDYSYPAQTVFSS